MLMEEEREECLRLIASLETRKAVPRHLLTKANLARFAAAATQRLHAEDAGLRKGYVRQFIDRVEVDDGEIRISGPQAELANGALDSDSGWVAGVPRFEQKWWRGKDSNLRRHKSTDLQSVAFDRSATPPNSQKPLGKPVRRRASK